MNKPNVLIVDDRPENLLVLEKVLSRLDINIVKADSGNKALSLILEHEFALVILDVQMPDMDGFETAALIRSDSLHHHIPIIFVTAISKDEKHVFEGYEAGAVDYLFKPINDQILLSKVSVFVALETQRMALAGLYRQNQLLLNCAAEGIIGIDKKGGITYANPMAAKKLEMKEDELIGKHIHLLMYPHGNGVSIPAWKDSPVYTVFVDGQNLKEPDGLFWRPHTGESFPVEYTVATLKEEDSKASGGVILFHDITERKQIENRLYQLAKFDRLTGLNNRTVFSEFLDREIGMAERHGRNLAVLLIDLDNLKDINDTKGREVGDMVLKSVAGRLKNSIRAGDLVARFEGNVFAVVLVDIINSESPAWIAKKILKQLTPSHNVAGYEIFTRAGIGITTYSNGHTTAEELIQAADIAMRQVEKEGTNAFRFFSPEMQEQVRERLWIEEDLRQYLEQDDLDVHFQPQVDAKNETIIGMEALIRWKHAEHGMISPVRFVSIAEESGLIMPMGAWIMKKACSDFVKFLSLIPDKKLILSIAVNVSVRQLMQEDFVSFVKKTLTETNLSPECLELEITESTLLDDPKKALNALKGIHELGCRVAIDDFGTGYSSLSYLRRMQIDCLKIDLSFVRNIGKNKNDEVIVKAVINLAHHLGLNVIAEGVETEEQAAFLKKNGCDVLQGYYFGRPVPFSDMKRLLVKAYK